MKSFSYSSQQIRELIESKRLLTPKPYEDRIQPSSFEPTISDHLYIVDVEYSGIFRVSKDEQVYEKLAELPSRRRQKVDISQGFELKKGFSYMIPLNEEITLEDEEHLKSSPKSSLGRLFLNTRLLGDFNPSIDELNSLYSKGRKIKLWLYVQPLAFNVIIHPGLSLNQLRFFKGYEAQLSPVELLSEIEQRPVLYTINSEGNEVPSDHIVTDGLILHLNLSGSSTEGVVGLRARHNPNPIDLALKSHYEVEDFFEPIQKQESISIKRGDYYLLSSKEILNVPPYLGVDLRDYSKVGFIGPLHFAGFTDNGFHGDLVYEVRSDELAKEVELTHNMPISKLDFFRTNTPDKIYGEAGNHYQLQIGTRPAKFFKLIDYKYLAQRYELLNRNVLTVDKNILMQFRESNEGFDDIKDKEGLLNEMENGFFQSRYACESDDLASQIVYYVIVEDEDGKILQYTKSHEIEAYPEKRLFGKVSIGIGCHILESESVNSPLESIMRELSEKKVRAHISNEPEFLGTVLSEQSPVDRSHFGLVYKIKVDAFEVVDNSVLDQWEFIDPNEIDKSKYNFESWAELII
jgi:dCTP deaminase